MTLIRSLRCHQVAVVLTESVALTETVELYFPPSKMLPVDKTPRVCSRHGSAVNLPAVYFPRIFLWLDCCCGTHVFPSGFRTPRRTDAAWAIAALFSVRTEAKVPERLQFSWVNLNYKNKTKKESCIPLVSLCGVIQPWTPAATAAIIFASWQVLHKYCSLHSLICGSVKGRMKNVNVIIAEEEKQREAEPPGANQMLLWTAYKKHKNMCSVMSEMSEYTVQYLEWAGLKPEVGGA